MRRLTDAGSLSGWAAFAGPLALYIATLSPGVAFWDTGEMDTVPWILGIPHPTGFPLFVLGGWLFSHVLPFGIPGWRISLFSATAVAGSAWLLWALVRDVTKSPPAAVAAAFAFAAGDIAWMRAVRAEVHDLVLFCISLAVVAARRAGETGSNRALLTAALACGLGLAVHPVAMFVLPCVAILAWPALRKMRLRTALGVAGALLAPLALYAYIPLRSAYIESRHLDPDWDLGLSGSAMFDDGSPSSLPAFWHYVTGATFQPGRTFIKLASPDGIVKAFGLWHDVVVWEFTWVMLAFAAAGFVFLVLNDRRLALGLSTLSIANITFAANYRIETDVQRYAMPALWVMVAFAAFGTTWIASSIVRDRSLATQWIAAGMLIAALWPNAGAAYDDVHRTNAYTDATAIGTDIAAVTPDGSLFVATWNYATPLFYSAFVAHQFGARRLICGWPPDYKADYPAWRKRFKHIYVVVNAIYDPREFARSVLIKGRWQLAELK